MTKGVVMPKPGNPSGGFSRPSGGFSGGFKPGAARNSPLPRPEAARAITNEMIAKRAYEIYASGQGGSADENWLRAERELKGW